MPGGELGGLSGCHPAVSSPPILLHTGGLSDGHRHGVACWEMTVDSEGEGGHHSVQRPRGPGEGTKLPLSHRWVEQVLWGGRKSIYVGGGC